MHIFLVDHIELAGIPCPIIALQFEVETLTDEMKEAFSEYEIYEANLLEVLVLQALTEAHDCPHIPWEIFDDARKEFAKDFAKEIVQELTR